MDKFITDINDALYGYVLIILLIVCGLYFTIRTGFAQFRLFGWQLRAVKEKPSDKEGVSAFQALMVSTASRVGTGNIIGVSTAICLGGFGSVFWMWIIAVVGGATALVESTLAQIFKIKGKDGFYGGPAYYIENGLNNKALAVAFSLCLILTYGFGFNMLASYNFQSTFAAYSFYDTNTTPWILGAVLAITVAYCIMGGGKRLVKITGALVPVMGILYVVVASLIVAANIDKFPAVVSRIFADAFDYEAIFGGISGSCVMYGIKRGLFSNEAGVGSAPNASAGADVSHPVTQGLVQVLSVFIDTLLICSATAFMCMFSGVEPAAELSGAPYIQQCFGASLGQLGPLFITVAMVLFAFTTLLGNLYYVDSAIVYLMKKVPSKAFMLVYRLIASLIVFLGCILSADLLWGIADVTMGAMTIINIPAILILGKYAFRAIKDFDAKKHRGIQNLEFRAEDIGLKDKTDFWK